VFTTLRVRYVVNMSSYFSHGRGRARLRALHVVVGATLVLVIYNPAVDAEQGRDLLRFVAVPALVLSGLAMWKLDELTGWLRTRRRRG
jgi:hypothetical protein